MSARSSTHVGRSIKGKKIEQEQNIRLSVDVRFKNGQAGHRAGAHRLPQSRRSTNFIKIVSNLMISDGEASAGKCIFVKCL